MHYRTDLYALRTLSSCCIWHAAIPRGSARCSLLQRSERLLYQESHWLRYVPTILQRLHHIIPTASTTSSTKYEVDYVRSSTSTLHIIRSKRQNDLCRYIPRRVRSVTLLTETRQPKLRSRWTGLCWLVSLQQPFSRHKPTGASTSRWSASFSALQQLAVFSLSSAGFEMQSRVILTGYVQHKTRQGRAAHFSSFPEQAHRKCTVALVQRLSP